MTPTSFDQAADGHGHRHQGGQGHGGHRHAHAAGELDPPTMPLLWRAGVAAVFDPSVSADVAGGKSLPAQVVSFAVVGGLATVIDLLGFNVLHFVVGMNPIVSKLLAISASTVFSYYGNRRWAFGVSDSSRHRRDLPMFIALNIVGLAIALGAVGATRYGLGMTSALALNVFGNGGGALLGTAFRFWAYRTLVFRASDDVPAPAPGLARAPSAQSGPNPRSAPATAPSAATGYASERREANGYASERYGREGHPAGRYDVHGHSSGRRDGSNGYPSGRYGREGHPPGRYDAAGRPVPPQAGPVQPVRNGQPRYPANGRPAGAPGGEPDDAAPAGRGGRHRRGRPASL